MLNVNYHLAKLEEDGAPIKVGIVGTGRMGTGAVCQIACMKGMNTLIAADAAVERAVRAFEINGYARDDIVVTESVTEATAALARGKVVATGDADVVPRAEVDVVVDATGVPEVGAAVGLASLTNGKHTIMLNVEADVLVGPILNRIALRSGLIYSGVYGDEPGLIKELYDFADALGFEVVALGKVPTSLAHFNREANPENIAEEARSLGQNPKMFCSFRDASKTMIEMAAVSNATGLVQDIPGMHGPSILLKDFASTFSLKSQGGILNRNGVVDFVRPPLNERGEVDYVNGLPNGLFCVATTDHPQIREDLIYHKMGDGPNYTFYRPYHMVGVEVPLTVAHAVIRKEPVVAPLGGIISEVTTKAKKDLSPGEMLDGGGGFTVYAFMELADEARRGNMLPFGLAENIRMKVAAKKDTIITYDMVELDETMAALQLRRLQDKLFQ